MPKYVRHYAQWLPKVSPELFGNGAPPRHFADLGASPGGLCEYLVGRLGWSGHARHVLEAFDYGGPCLVLERAERTLRHRIDTSAIDRASVPLYLKVRSRVVTCMQP